MKYDGIVLFSGGLDSLLAAKILTGQGLKILCAHFWSPFFGAPQKAGRWSGLHNLDVRAFDASLPFVQMLAEGPENGFGKHLNPCVDCKILLLRLARELMPQFGASFLATGEVIGQRPMSQRRDSLMRIQNKAGVAALLLRPLSAKLLEPVECETSGLVDREGLFAFSGRGRDGQLGLAEKYGLAEVPAPAGGCLLTEKENTRRYWHLLERFRESGSHDFRRLAADFSLCRFGRQLFKADRWLCVGRNAADNEGIRKNARETDVIFKLRGFPGPLVLARDGASWPAEMLAEAAAMAVRHSPKAVKSGAPVRVGLEGAIQKEIIVPGAAGPQGWGVPDWDDTRRELQALRKKG